MRRDGTEQLIGSSPVIAELTQEIARIAKSDAKVLITGESGVGKELVANAIHQGSPRAHRGFLAVNCAGLSETLLESELFGHVKGSFTGAYRDKQGKLEMADASSIFLDEIGEMTLRMQGLLLRFMETGELQKVGADRGQGRVNVRVIAATNRNLRHMISEGTFREDLFYRLNVIHLTVPPLRERREDIPVLIEHFLTRFTRTNSNPGGNGNGTGNRPGYFNSTAPGFASSNTSGYPNSNMSGFLNSNRSAVGDAGRYDASVKYLSPEAIRLLCEYSWPGNVRELENVIERLVVTARTGVIGENDLPLEIRTQNVIGARPRRERRRTVADDLYEKLINKSESFWTAVYPLYMQREITRGNVRDLVRKGLEDARGNYKIVAKLFNMESNEYKRFLNFLRKHDCHLPFKEYRQ